MEPSEFAKIAAVLVFAYLLGSMPTALIISRRFKDVDIRTIGDGNMGARNTYHSIGPKFGIMVAVIDFFKGALPVLLAYLLGLELGWQFLAGAMAILGHDFPLFANFRGGQGTASTFGTMGVLFPIPTLAGLVFFGGLYLITKNSRLGCAIGGAIVAGILAVSQQWLLLIYAVVVFIFIPIKLFIDSPRRRAIALAKSSRN
jgi:glycerol-3-phosphate acyltransferase PlsY